MTSALVEGNRGLTSNELLLCLRTMHSSSPIAVANKRDFLNLYTESDFVAATMAGQVYEYEVKVSRKDFFRDRTKHRNRIYSGEIPGRKPNRFWYVTARGIVTIEDVPAFAGWLEWQDGQLVQMRKAPLLHQGCHGIDVLMYLARAMRNRT